jgi:nitroimidazol reductase NimA-like FMN-containing flavoprotein (pyridoxamine 5'-phosphate oxidase superfamily)
VGCFQLPVFEELGPEDCLELLREEPLGHVALTARALPVVLPVSFAVSGGDIVWRSAQGTKLNDACCDFVVAFEADHYEPDHAQGWSVMVQGLAHVVTDSEELDRARELPLESWTSEGVADRYVCLVPDVVTGRRIRKASTN